MTIECGRCSFTFVQRYFDVAEGQNLSLADVPRHLDDEGKDCPLGGNVLPVGRKHA